MKANWLTPARGWRGRRIVVGGVEWRWKLGSGCVLAVSEKGERRKAEPWTIKGIAPDDWEQGHWNGTRDGMLTPGNITRWLLADSLRGFNGKG